MYQFNQILLQKLISVLSALIVWLSNITEYIINNRQYLNNGNLQRRVDFIDNWWVNYQIGKRHWRIPQMCNFISKKYGSIAELMLQGQRVVILNDLPLASRLLTKHGHFLRQRFGNIAGLKNLNMYNTGLIWNNEVATWKKNRIAFEAALKSASKALDGLSDQYFAELRKTIKSHIATPVSVLDIVRDYTVTVTLEGIFGITSNTRAWRDRAKTTVANYFKAWEFFLLGEGDAGREKTEYLHACDEMLRLSKEIFDIAKKTAGGSDFINKCTSHCGENGTSQCIAEMLLAGTDTSSLTMFYTLLYLSDNPGTATSISTAVRSRGTADAEIMHLYYESMRLVPVGPVILRQAETSITEGGIVLEQGDGIILNIAGMNRSSAHYSNVQEFNPSRFEGDGTEGIQEPLPLSFGTGKKSCVGKGFAEQEMKLFFSWFLKDYAVFGQHGNMVDQLETRWDIANAPVGDLRLSIFPRILVFLVGAPDERSSILKIVRAEYPKIRIQDGKLREQILATNSSVDEDLLIQAHDELMKSLENQFAFVAGSIYDCIFELNNSFDRFEGSTIFSKMKNQLVIQISNYKIHPTKKEVEMQEGAFDDDAFSRFLNRSGCKYYSLESKTKLERVDEVFTLLRRF